MSKPDAEDVYVHPNALCESNRVGAGTRVWAFAHVMADAEIGETCNICGHAFIETGAVIGDRVTVKNGVMIWNGVTIENDVFVGPGAVFTNDRFPRSRQSPSAEARYAQEGGWLEKTKVCQGATIGAGAVILPGLEIGACATVAAGAVVTSDVEAYRLVAGNPARAVGWVGADGWPIDAKPDLSED